jgi:phosphate transport system protein
MSHGTHPEPAPPAPRSFDVRPHFHQDLESLEAEVTDMAALARQSLQRSLDVLDGNDASLSEAVIRGDDELDQRYQQIESRAVDLIARQQPMATDLRQLMALIHVALHLERIGDMAVNVAEATRAASGLPPRRDILEHLQQMGDRTIAMVDLSVEAFIKRDRAMCEQLGELDDEIDELNDELVSHAVGCRGDEGQLRWAIRMLQVSRYLERAADHAVDIGEQAWYLTTGERRELD